MGLQGYAYDTIEAALAAGSSNLPDLLARVDAVHRVRDEPAFLSVALAAKRIANIVKDSPEFEVKVDLLREEARLAAMVGDTAGAIDAYQHYFALRDFRPDHPPWAAQWDSMRVEYGALTGVEGP